MHAHIALLNYKDDWRHDLLTANYLLHNIDLHLEQVKILIDSAIVILSLVVFLAPTVYCLALSAKLAPSMHQKSDLINMCFVSMFKIQYIRPSSPIERFFSFMQVHWLTSQGLILAFF